METDDVNTLTFEEALAELESIIERLDSGDLLLEEALALFERGQALADHCGDQLEAASLRVEQLTEHGEIAEINSDNES